MSYRKIFWGVLLVIIGILFILKNTGAICFSWHTVWHLWPLILILWGISLIPVKDWIKLVLSVVTVILGFFAVQQYGNYNDDRWFHFNWRDHQNRIEYKDDVTEYPNFMSQDYTQEIRDARLELNVGAGQFMIEDTCSKLVEVRYDNTDVNYSMTSNIVDSVCNVHFNLDKGEFHDGKIVNSVRFKLNPKPVWDLDLNVGAAEVDFDLSPFKTRKLRIEGGASDMDVKIGDKLDFSEVDVEAGAASITIRVPESVGCEIISDTFLASRDFKGFTKKNGRYLTPNFDSSSKKVKIHVQAGMASVDVVRY